jgi:hypothetical protein
MSAEPIHRFAGRYEPDMNSGCWLWSGATTPDGYGVFKIAGIASLAHRAAWHLFKGALPLCVCHRCDTPQCVNPEHLFAGDRPANNRDRHRKGRSRGGSNAGENSPLAKLNERSVAQIRATAAAGVSQREVAKQHGISQGHVSAIVNGKKWGAA